MKIKFRKNFNSFFINEISQFTRTFNLSRDHDLVNKYSKNDSLYPKDPQKLQVIKVFDIGSLHQSFVDYY